MMKNKVYKINYVDNGGRKWDYNYKEIGVVDSA